MTSPPPVSSRASRETRTIHTRIHHPHKPKGSRFVRSAVFEVVPSLYVVGKSYIHIYLQHHGEGCCRHARIRLVKSMRTGISQSASSVFKKGHFKISKRASHGIMTQQDTQVNATHDIVLLRSNPRGLGDRHSCGIPTSSTNHQR